jgi:REP element-mobilizing transposase RayT
MPYDPRVHHRRSIRLSDHDYTAGGTYFITICTANRSCLLGEVTGPEMVLNTLGEAVQEEWLRSAEIRPGTDLHEYVVMPNHFHALVTIREPEEGVYAPTEKRAFASPKRGLSSLVRGFKGASTRRAKSLMPDIRELWQGDYFERVIRNEREFAVRQQYIIENPMRWADDEDNPANW